MKAVFLSDAHIRDHADPNLPPLLGFLDHLAGRTERLCIVGDLFDTWFAFGRAVFDEYVPLLGAIERLKRSGTRIVYVTGNHDFELGKFFEQILEAEIHDTQFVLEEDGRRAFVAHGDMVNPHDRKYRRLRRILRARPTRWLGRNLPPSWVWRIARRLTVRCTGDEIAARIPLKEVFREYAEDLHRRGFDTVILGHLHLPQFEQRPAAVLRPCSAKHAAQGEAESSDSSLRSTSSARLDPPPAAAGPESPAQVYANLGDWVRWRTFLRWEDGRLELRQWSWPEAVERPFRP
jgi:UDP-2,3-diacylglucosamine hydrolase